MGTSGSVSSYEKRYDLSVQFIELNIGFFLVKTKYMT